MKVDEDNNKRGESGVLGIYFGAAFSRNIEPNEILIMLTINSHSLENLVK